MLEEDFSDIDVNTVIRAIENGYSEGKELEFKREQNPANQGHKQTTVSEIVSFANARGGDLVIGLSDDEGTASALWPTEYDDIDGTILQWIDIVRRNTDPEIPQHLVDIKSIEITQEHTEYVDEHSHYSTGHLLVIRVSRSWRSPHRETLKNQYYERSSGGKSELDAGAIRQAILEQELVTDRAEEFRDDRLAAIQADDIAVPLQDGPKVVLHIFPSNALAERNLLDPSTANNRSNDAAPTVPPLLHPRGTTGGWSRYTEDGYLQANRGGNDPKFEAYTLTFRSGVIEAMTVNMYAEGPRRIHAGSVRNCLEKCLPYYLEYLDSQGVAYPIYIFFNVLGAKGIPVGNTREATRVDSQLEVIDRDVVRLPAVLVETPNSDFETTINDLLDYLYNASGKGQETRVK